MEEDDDDFQLVQMELITLGKNRYDIFELYKKEDNEGDCYFYGIYDIKNRGFIAGRANRKEELARNLSSIAKMRKRGLHRFVGARVRIGKHWLFLN